MKKLAFIVLAIAMGYFCPVFAQTKSLQLGIKVMGELTLYDGLAPGGGLQLIYRTRKHGGIETGIVFQSRKTARLFFESSPVSTQFQEVEIFSQRLQFPVLYRFNSKALNFTVGPVFDFRIGSHAKPADYDPALKHYKGYGSQVITSAGISHSFNLSSTWVLEPEITYNHNFNRDDGGMGINLALRKVIR
jgi:hypothetical protein